VKLSLAIVVSELAVVVVDVSVVTVLVVFVSAFTFSWFETSSDAAIAANATIDIRANDFVWLFILCPPP
jgi:hypothetical protein